MLEQGDFSSQYFSGVPCRRRAPATAEAAEHIMRTAHTHQLLEPVEYHSPTKHSTWKTSGTLMFCLVFLVVFTRCGRYAHTVNTPHDYSKRKQRNSDFQTLFFFFACVRSCMRATRFWCAVDEITIPINLRIVVAAFEVAIAECVVVVSIQWAVVGVCNFDVCCVFAIISWACIENNNNMRICERRRKKTSNLYACHRRHRCHRWHRSY